MKLFIFILLFSSTLNIWSQQNSNILNGTRFWGHYSVGYGELTNKDSKNTKHAIPLSFAVFLSKKKNIFSINYRNSSNVNKDLCFTCPPLDYINEINFQYGFNFNKKRYALNIMSGIGFAFGKRRTYLGEEISYNYYPPQTFKVYKFIPFKTINFPVDANFIWIVKPKFGITVNGFSSFNYQLIDFGGTIGITYGKLR